MRLPLFFSRLVCAGIASLSFHVWAEDGYLLPPASEKAPTSVTSANLPLSLMAQSFSNGATQTCIPLKLSVLGKAQDGARLYVSAPLAEFSSTLRKSARGSSKLTLEQGRLLDQLLLMAQRSQQTGTPFPTSFIDSVAARTHLDIQMDMACLSLQTFSAPRVVPPSH